MDKSEKNNLCEICKKEKELDIYIGIEGIFLICESCIYEEELKIGPK